MFTFGTMEDGLQNGNNCLDGLDGKLTFQWKNKKSNTTFDSEKGIYTVCEKSIRFFNDNFLQKRYHII